MGHTDFAKSNWTRGKKTGMLPAWLYPKSTGDPGGDRHAASLHFGCLALFITFALLLLRSVGWRHGDQSAPLATAELAVLAALAMNYVGKWTWAARFITGGVLFATAWLVIEAQDGFRSISMLAFPGLLMMAVMLLKAADYLVLAAATLGTVTFLGVAEIQGMVPTVPIVRSTTDWATVAIVDLTLVVIAIFGWLLARDTRLNLAEIRGTVDKLAAANRELARSEEKYRSFIELAVDAIFVASRDGVILEVNRQASSLTGLARDELLGVSMLTILSPSEAGEDPFPLGLLAEGVPIMRACRIGCSGGAVMEAELHSVMLPEGRILCFCRDISERIRTEQQLGQLQKMESIGRLAGGVAHDFNNLLTVISGYGRLLLEEMAVDSQEHERMLQILSAGDRAAELTRQLLTFSRKQHVSPKVLDINTVVEDTGRMLRRIIGEEVQLTTVLSPSLGAVIADAGQIGDTLLNLAVNARDAMPDGGQLWIETRNVELGPGVVSVDGEVVPGSYVQFSVADSGMGMDEATQRRIFEPFFTTKTVGKGTGLGLAMVHGIVKQSGGFIQVASKPGQGSKFTLWFPRVDDRLNQLAEAPAGARDVRGTETILLVEDQDSIRSYATEVLRGAGYTVIEADSGSAALLAAEGHAGPIHLLLSDIVMPGMNGRELAGRLLEARPSTKVLYVSGNAGAIISSQEASEPGGTFLAKPYSPGALTAKVFEALSDGPRGDAAPQEFKSRT
jgi:PAS domain S-box-containing protein